MSNEGRAWEYSSKGELAQNLIVNENNIPLISAAIIRNHS